jgi:hypothetical protein
MNAALRAELPAHDIAAVGSGAKFAQLSFNGDGRSHERRINRATAHTDVLANTTPARTGEERHSSRLIPHCLAQTSTGQFHLVRLSAFFHQKS